MIWRLFLYSVVILGVFDMARSAPGGRIKAKAAARRRKEPENVIKPGDKIQLTKAQQKYAERQLRIYQKKLEKQETNVPQPSGSGVELPGPLENAYEINKFRNTNPYGPFDGQFGWANNTGVVVLGTGYRRNRLYQGGWPNIYTQQKGVDAYALGRKVGYFPKNFQISPAGSVSEWNIGRERGGTVLNTGFLRNNGGHGGISGYSWGKRFRVPVLGTNVVDQTRGSGLDITGFNWASGRTGQYGPVQLQTKGTQFNSPWLGKLISNGIYNKALKRAGYSGLAGGAYPQEKIPGVPFVG